MGTEDLLARLMEWNRAASARDSAADRDETFIKIEAIDDPGWMVLIDGEAGREFIQYEHRLSDEDWMEIRADARKFVGDGDIARLPVLLRCGLDWTESRTTSIGEPLSGREGYE